jgi:hypothetical protein
MKFRVSILPNAKRDIDEIRDKLLGLGSRPSYRAVFTIQDGAVYVLAVRRSTQDTIRPTDIEF